ncbi:hypothetical protein AB205_0085000 [Aquarana catesbeiana]|uniref:Ig-like domain-containing protein n=1 Tax=Aquarana catesbeiana TaxID=8400 RepID=A0A2G9QB98_AQUCT|nr:hypothetical protein AB205_0085000 [Aquarana catesbeiana]
MRTSVVSVLRDEDVAIHCDVSGLNPGSAIAVLWRRTSENGTEYDVYNYIDEKETSYRPGSYIEPKEVRKGNAELHLPRVQISDEGVYTCTVINTPNSAEGRATLQVSAAPLVYVTPEKPTIELGTEKTVMCKVYNFYPKNIFMQWVQCHKSSSKRKVLKIWKKFHENSDGTYNETSLLTLNPKMEDNENIYSCIINHRSLQTELSRNVTLIVTGQ